ncbi:hypothetical protein SF12_16425 [Streptomyces sp. MBRL 601]|nr:hypothetical protein SF12_16425 [Streptomyces sp. MBRL 601]
MVAAPDLVDGVRQEAAEDGEPVADPAGGAGQVDDEGASGESGQAPGEGGGGDLGQALGADGLGDAGISRSSRGRVASGVRSVGLRPVPPVVTTTS